MTRPGDLGWVVMANAEAYTEQFGWNGDYETLVLKIVSDYAQGNDPSRSAAWIAELDGDRVGCVFCVPADAETAKLRLLLVHPAARGHGLGSRLVEQCMQFAREAGYKHMTLWTNSILASARRIYEANGFKLEDEAPHHSFGKPLVGQNWSRPL